MPPPCPNFAEESKKSWYVDYCMQKSVEIIFPLRCSHSIFLDETAVMQMYVFSWQEAYTDICMRCCNISIFLYGRAPFLGRFLFLDLPLYLQFFLDFLLILSSHPKIFGNNQLKYVVKPSSWNMGTYMWIIVWEGPDGVGHLIVQMSFLNNHRWKGTR